MRSALIAIVLVLCVRELRAETCHTGDVVAKTDAELAVLANATCLVGNLEISHDVTSLRPLAKLTRIEGSIRIHTAKKLRSLAGLDKLEQLTGSLSIGGPKMGVPVLRNVDGLGKLVEIGGHLSIRGGYIFIPSHSMVAPIQDVTGLRALARVKGSVHLHDVSAFRGLNAVVEIGSLTVDHTKLTDLRGFAKLERIHGNVVLDGNPKLKRISLASVTRISGDVIAGCPNRNDVLSEKALRAWADKITIDGDTKFVQGEHSGPPDADPCF